ncbi:MAG TPA: endonuclease V [Anaerolineales bacterium]|nr:endonuclease V [Anaerolineales bacterium]
MSLNTSLPWTYDLDQAMRIQQNLSKRLSLTWDDHQVKTVAGIDTDEDGIVIHAAVSVYHFPELTRIVTVTGTATQGFPYVSGMLAFRLGPAILKAWEKLKLTPDLVMIHGHGIAHPRGFGLASHIGLWINLPTIGVAKTSLYGKYAEVGPNPGDWSEIHDEQQPRRVIGAALRTQLEVKPVYVSPGNLIDLSHSIEFVMACARKYRMPEPIRLAQEIATKSRQGNSDLVSVA